MSLVTIIWSIIASACLTLASMHLLIWCKKRTAWASLLFALMAVATATVVACELLMMRAETAREFGMIIRWSHVPYWVLIISLVVFVRVYLRAGRPWLAWTVCVMRTFSLLLNFLTGQNLNYREVTGLRHVPFFGEFVSVAEGISNPWMLVGQLSLLLLVIFAVDATLAVWRRGDRRPLVLLGGTIVFFVMGNIGQFVLTFWGFIHKPVTPSLFFLGIVVAMAYEMSGETLRAEYLADSLRKGEEWLDLAVDSAGVGLWLWDFKTNLLWITEKTRMFYGLSSHGQVPFETFLSNLHPDDLHWVTQTGQKCSQEGADFRYDYRIVMPDGSIRWLNVLAKVFLGSSGKPERMTGVSLDITDRKRAEELLLKTQQQLQAILDGTPSLVYVKDLEGRFLLVNRSFESMFGLPCENLIGKTSYDLMPKEIADAHRAADIEVMAKREEVLIEEVNDEPDGKHTYLSVKFPLFDQVGKMYGVCGFSTDITHRKQAEQEIEKQRNELAHITRVSTMSQLASSLAHELNQPLGAIMRNAEAGELFLQDPSPDLDEVRAILADIRSDNQRAGTVIDRMRSLLKRHEIERNLLDLKLLAGEVITLMSSEAVTRKVRLALKPVSSLPPVRGDRVHLQQVLLNLLLNAMDAMNDSAPDGRRITVSVQDAGTQVEVAVSDTGHGIPADKLAHVFEPFFSTKPNGLGMGLAICRSIIEAHRGSIRAKNNEAGGATFTITLPALAGDDTK